MDLSLYWRKKPLCKFSWSYDDRYYIDFMVRTDPRITDTQTHPQTTARGSVENYSTRGLKPSGTKIHFSWFQLEWDHQTNLQTDTASYRDTRLFLKIGFNRKCFALCTMPPDNLVSCLCIFNNKYLGMIRAVPLFLTRPSRNNQRTDLPASLPKKQLTYQTANQLIYRLFETPKH